MPSGWLASLLRHGLPPLLSVLLVVLPVVADDALPLAAQQPPAAPGRLHGARAATRCLYAATRCPCAASHDRKPQSDCPGWPDEVNDIQRKVMAPLVIEVLDQNDRPVEGAEVVFRFPLEAPLRRCASGRTSQTMENQWAG